jgi:hypothetical protein
LIPFKTIRWPLFMLISGVSHMLYAQQPGESVLQSHNWYKLSVERDGIYRITFDFLKKMGVDPGKTDPATIKIYGNGGGMLPQSNSVERPYDLIENAIFVSGTDDGRFDRNDFILFYAEGPDKSTFDTRRQIFSFQNNLYSDKNFYFLTISADAGKRAQVSDDLGTDAPVISTFNDFTFYEKDEFSVLHSGREWFGEKFGITTNEHSFSFPAAGITSGSPFKIVSDVLGQSYTNASFKLFMNDAQVGEQYVLPVTNSQYAAKGIHKRDTIILNSSDAGADSRTLQQVKYQFMEGQGTSEGALDFFLVSFERRLALYNDQTVFLSAQSLVNVSSRFEVGSVPDGAGIWDVTDPFNCRLQAFSLNNQVATFTTATGKLKKFIVFNNKVPAPVFVGKVPNQNLHGQPTPDLIIITHPLFKEEAQRLADHRHAFSNWSVEVVTTEQVFNEFSSGRQDVSAIRDFVKHRYDRSPTTLKALLLFGKGSYDFKERVPQNTNYVTTYESRNSLHPLQTFSSDDYFGFLENAEGNWGEDPAQNHTLDIGVGRLPVTSVDNARGIVDKIIRYDTDKKAFGYWRKRIVFVADDGSTDDGFTSLHQYQANQLAEFIEGLGIGADTRKLFMGSYAKTVQPNGEFTPRLTEDVVSSFDRGSLIINYTGHGSAKQWADEDFFNNTHITKLDNELYPFLVTATCEFGRHDDPKVISGAERAVTQKNGGAIGLVTTARPVNATTNFNLNQAFYEALFQHNENSYLSIGEVFRKTKNNSTSGVANRNFSLLCDPSLSLALPANTVHVTSLTTAKGSDTLKALSTVIARGEIRDFSGKKMTSFNGTVEVTLFDKQTSFSTIGKNNPAFAYKQWSNALFRGRATVAGGEFELNFMIPKNIAYQVAAGKFSLYASDPDTHQDASGAGVNFKIGGSETDVVADNSAPSIRLFMGDSTFVNGGITTPDTYLVADLRDNSGINISDYGIGNSIIAVLDEDAGTYILNDYYVANTDDPASGYIRYPVKGLSPGKHTFTVRAWDVFNNSVESSVDFIVTDNQNLVVESFGNYPNPFRENTTLFFTHNRPGDDLQAQVFIQNIAGETVKSGEIMIPASDYKVNLMDLSNTDNFDKKLSAGLYLARIIVRSLTNGSKNEQVTKLIILN